MDYGSAGSVFLISTGTGGGGWAWSSGRFTPETNIMLDCISNVMAHAQKPDFVFR
jgi:hypothetical protein